MRLVCDHRNVHAVSTVHGDDLQVVRFVCTSCGTSIPFETLMERHSEDLDVSKEREALLIKNKPK